MLAPTAKSPAGHVESDVVPTTVMPLNVTVVLPSMDVGVDAFAVTWPANVTPASTTTHTSMRASSRTHRDRISATIDPANRPVPARSLAVATQAQPRAKTQQDESTGRLQPIAKTHQTTHPNRVRRESTAAVVDEDVWQLAPNGANRDGSGGRSGPAAGLGNLVSRRDLRARR